MQRRRVIDIILWHQVPLPGLGTYELEPVFYAPDGQVLTMEEYDFLQEYGINDDENFG